MHYSNETVLNILHPPIELTSNFLCCSAYSPLFVEQNDDRDKVATEEKQRRHRNFHDTTNLSKTRRERQQSDDARRERLRRQTERLERELNTASYRRMISRFDQVFNSNLAEFMSELKSHHTYLSNLRMRLDFNGYVTQSLGP